MTPHRYAPLNWIQWVTLILLVGMLVTVPILFVRITNLQRHQGDGLRSVICLIEARVQHTPPSATFTLKQKRQALQFYDEALSKARLAPCH